MTGFSCSLAEQQKLTDNRWSSSENSSQTVYIERCCFVRHFVQLLPCCRLRRDRPCDEEPSFPCSCVPCIPFNLRLFICRVNSRCSVKKRAHPSKTPKTTRHKVHKTDRNFAGVSQTCNALPRHRVEIAFRLRRRKHIILNHCGHLWPPVASYQIHARRRRDCMAKIRGIWMAKTTIANYERYITGKTGTLPQYVLFLEYF